MKTGDDINNTLELSRLTDEERAIINIMELAVDYNMSVSEDFIEKYNKIMKRIGGKQDERKSSNSGQTVTDSG